MRHETSSRASDALTVIGAAGLGMLTMYLIDPDSGRRRRARMADKLRSRGLDLRRMADVASRDGINRGRGLMSGWRSRLEAGQPISGQQLRERVRARIGRVVSNSHAIDVRASEDGTVVLSGPILASEVGKLMVTAWAVRGVKKVDNRLDVHEAPGSVSALQGTEAARRRRAGMENWPPSVRVLAASAGLAAAALSASRGRALGLLGAMAGGALLARSVANQRLGEITGLSGTHSVHLDKEMFIAAPPEQVFEFWCHPEKFPQFMRNVQEVQAAGEDRWHWKVSGPFRPVEWDAQIVEREENRRLVWRSVPGASVESEGRVDFEPAGEGTRIRVAMSYTPTAGAVGHLLARLLGRDAKTELDEDLMRVKSFFETGRPAHDAFAARAARAEHGQHLH